MPIASSITPVQDSRFVESTLSLSRDAAPPLRPLIAGSLFAILACVLTGPFDTDVLPVPSRLVFWLVLIGWNSVKWWLWYGWVGPRTTDRRTVLLAAVVGALLLNATLPLEIDLMFRAIGRPLQLSWLGLYLMALLVAGLISALIAVLRQPRAVPQQPQGPDRRQRRRHTKNDRQHGAIVPARATPTRWRWPPESSCG